MFIYLKTVQQYLLNTYSFLGTEHIIQIKIDLLATLIILKFEIGRVEVGVWMRKKSSCHQHVQVMFKPGLRSGAAKRLHLLVLNRFLHVKVETC